MVNLICITMNLWCVPPHWLRPPIPDPACHSARCGLEVLVLSLSKHCHFQSYSTARRLGRSAPHPMYYKRKNKSSNCISIREIFLYDGYCGWLLCLEMGCLKAFSSPQLDSHDTHDEMWIGDKGETLLFLFERLGELRQLLGFKTFS